MFNTRISLTQRSFQKTLRMHVTWHMIIAKIAHLSEWDVCEVEIEDKIEFSEDKDTAWFTFRCWTAWAPPIPVWNKLFAMGIEVQAEYVDEGGWFEGEYALGQDNCWRPEIEEDDGVASDEEFGLEDTIDVFKNLIGRS